MNVLRIDFKDQKEIENTDWWLIIEMKIEFWLYV